MLQCKLCNLIKSCATHLIITTLLGIEIGFLPLEMCGFMCQALGQVGALETVVCSSPGTMSVSIASWMCGFIFQPLGQVGALHTERLCTSLVPLGICGLMLQPLGQVGVLYAELFSCHQEQLVHPLANCSTPSSQFLANNVKNIVIYLFQLV